VKALVEQNPYVGYSAIVDRPPIRWPNGARIALWVAPNIEHYEYQPPPNDHRQFWTRVPVPDVMGYSFADYGNRVGFWRMLEVLDHYEIPASVSLNLGVLDMFPEIGEAIAERNWSVFSHGIFNTRFLFGMTPDEERAWVQDNIETLRRHTGLPLRGMFGPALSQTPNSMEIWAEAGLTYVVDWFMDDQPFPLDVKSGKLVNVTYGWETNDARAMGGAAYGGTYETDYFLQICKDQFDVLYDEGAESGRVMCIALHPFLIGQPWRVRYLDDLFSYVLQHEGVWLTTAEAIADFYIAQYYDEAVARQRGSATPFPASAA
jgi:peptidoglycan/xylan/chitin deacetylase (PgdA/CDA1 family)